MNHTGTLTMFIIMIISGLLSAMYIWADSSDDIRISLNDLYMSLLMASWMLIGMGIVEKVYTKTLLGFVLVAISLYFIRNQIFITQSQYIQGMIPHHSMAVFMSKKLLRRGEKLNSHLEKLAKSIIKSQEYEINILKSF